MEKMTFYFKREDNNFDDLLSEKCIKRAEYKLFYTEHVIIHGSFSEKELNYLTLKYGDEMTNPVTDFTPKPYTDYIPVRHK